MSSANVENKMIGSTSKRFSSQCIFVSLVADKNSSYQTSTSLEIFRFRNLFKIDESKIFLRDDLCYEKLQGLKSLKSRMLHVRLNHLFDIFYNIITSFLFYCLRLYIRTRANGDDLRKSPNFALQRTGKMVSNSLYIFKFMRIDAGNELKEIAYLDEKTNLMLEVNNGSRVLRCGRLMRKPRKITELKVLFAGRSIQSLLTSTNILFQQWSDELSVMFAYYDTVSHGSCIFVCSASFHLQEKSCLVANSSLRCDASYSISAEVAA